MNWKQLPRLDKDLVKFLTDKFPPIKYNDHSSSEELARLLAKQDGRLDVIQTINKIISLQNKG